MKVDSTASLTRQSEGQYQLSGELDFESVLPVLAESSLLFNNDQEDLLIDLTGVRRGNSAALGLLLEWVHLARQQQRNIWFRNIPKDLMSVAKVSDLDKLLPIEN